MIDVPFLLLPSAANEAQFLFTVENITVPQKLRGSLSYILMVSQSTTLQISAVYQDLCLPNRVPGSYILQSRWGADWG